MIDRGKGLPAGMLAAMGPPGNCSQLHVSAAICKVNYLSSSIFSTRPAEKS